MVAESIEERLLRVEALLQDCLREPEEGKRFRQAVDLLDRCRPYIAHLEANILYDEVSAFIAAARGGHPYPGIPPLPPRHQNGKMGA